MEELEIVVFGAEMGIDATFSTSHGLEISVLGSEVIVEGEGYQQSIYGDVNITLDEELQELVIGVAHNNKFIFSLVIATDELEYWELKE